MSTGVHSLFVVGRISKGQRRLIFLRTPVQPLFPGPWELRAIFAN